MFREAFERFSSSPPAEKQMLIVLAMKGPGVSPLPHPQDKAECLMVVSRLLFEGTMATCHPPGIAEVGGLWGKSPFQVAESVIGRPKDNRSWTGSGAECRDAVCVGVLHNCTFRP